MKKLELTAFKVVLTGYKTSHIDPITAASKASDDLK